MFEVGVVGQFEAAHRLEGDFGPASGMHGHTYRVEVAVRGERLKSDGTLCDIGRLREALDGILAKLHLQVLGELDLFEGRNSTAEVVAEVIATRLKEAVSGDSLQTLAVRVWESPLAFAGIELTLD